MSQITRCPSCSTSFKVVADQLRISQGWVRCGQCKEVFDASAHLLPAAPPALLPDVSLTDIRPPSMPVARKAEAGRSWGEPPSTPPPVGPSAGALSPASEKPAFSLFPTGASEGMAGLPDAQAQVVAPVLEVPQPAVPAFLSAAAGAVAPGADAGIGPFTPFAWRPDSVRNVPTTGGDVAGMRSDAVALPPLAFPEVAADGPSSLPKGAHTPASLSAALPGAGDGTSLPAGYELPAAALRDGEEVAADSAAAVALTPMGYPALELPTKTALPVEDAELEERAEVPVPPVGFAQPATPEPEPEALALVEDHSPAAVLQASTRKRSSVRKASDAVDEDDDPEAGQEVSFVVAARRKAFWRRPMVRTVLGVLLLMSVAGLALQVAVQERDRLAAMDARARPWLMALCAPLHCEIAPPRQIADVVIDSSSFNKARGDSYQLALTMKSKASIPLAMPAVELTLTDAQDQPVLRRVLLPTDMGAPMELSAGGEWSASVSVIVTTGGARVAGYRLLAFYP